MSARGAPQEVRDDEEPAAGNDLGNGIRVAIYICFHSQGCLNCFHLLLDGGRCLDQLADEAHQLRAERLVLATAGRRRRGHGGLLVLLVGRGQVELGEQRE